MRFLTYRLFFYSSMIMAPMTLWSADLGKTYGGPGTFDFSTGLTVAYTSHNADFQQYNFGALPYANHFLWNKVFFRYEGLLGTNYFKGGYEYVGITFGAGLGIGYSFQFSDKWFLNLSLGYAGAYGYNKASYYVSGTWSGSQAVNIHPELKYVISDKWAIGVLMRAASTLPDSIANSSSRFSVTTNTYVIVSYFF